MLLWVDSWAFFSFRSEQIYFSVGQGIDGIQVLSGPANSFCFLSMEEGPSFCKIDKQCAEEIVQAFFLDYSV